MVMILRIPLTPSASYLAPGSVITSMRLIIEAGIDLSTSLGLRDQLLLGRPFLKILKLELPSTFMFSSPSTVTRGTFFSISKIVLVLESSSAWMS